MSAMPFFIHRLMENVTDRREVASNSKGRTDQEGDNKCGYCDKNNSFEMACHFAYAFMFFLVPFMMSKRYANARRDLKCC